jgi:hypothetical protein
MTGPAAGPGSSCVFMRTSALFLACLALLPATSHAQSVRLQGRVLDAVTKAPVPGVYLRFRGVADTTDVHAGATADDGAFTIPGLAPARYRLTAERLGYATLTRAFTIDRANPNAGDLLMTPEAVPQPGITVKASPPTAIQKADTTEFAADAVKTAKDANAEDLVAKLPGVTVDNSGTVKSNGEQVKQVLVDGKPYFGGDPTIALRNLPAEVVDKIQVYDQMSDQSQFTGFDDGQSVRTMNVTLRGRRRMQFGKLSAGRGDRGRYQAAGNETIVRGAQRWSLLGLANNVNQQNFSAQDLVGALSSGGGQRGGGFGGAGEGRRFGSGGGGGRDRGPGGAGGGAFGGNAAGPGSFFVGQQDGVTSTVSTGSNFNGAVTKTLQGNGSYFFNHTDNDNTQMLARTFAPPLDSIARYGQASVTNTRNDNHRVDARMEWTPDSSNSVVVQPRLYFQRNRSASDQAGSNVRDDGSTLNLADNAGSTTTSGNNLSGHVIARHKFAARGRTLSLDLGGGGTLRDNAGSQRSTLLYPLFPAAGDTVDERTGVNTTTRSMSARAVLTEPLGAHSLLQLFYAPSGTFSRSRSNAFLLDAVSGNYVLPDSALTNTFENTSIAQNGGAGILMRRGGLNLMANVAYQRSTLRSEQTYPAGGTISRTFRDVLPSLMLNWNGPDRSNLRVSLQSSTRPPAISQLQNVTDNSNPLILTSGNPDLKQSTSQSLVTRYSHTDPAKSRTLFAMLSLQRTGRYIANQTVTATRDTVVAGGLVLLRGTQLVSPVNLEGAWNANSFVTVGRPVARLKSVLNLIGGVSYARTPGLIGRTETVSNTWAINPGVTLASNISPNLDFTLNYNGTINLARNTATNAADGDYYTHSAGLRLNVTLPNGIVLRDEVNHALTDGVSGGYDQDVVLWNSSIAKKLFKDDRGELRLSGADVLGQNRSTRRTVTETYIQDVRNRTLGQYVMLTFTYTMR